MSRAAKHRARVGAEEGCLTLYGTAWRGEEGKLWFSFYEDSTREKLDDLVQPGDYKPYKNGAFKVKYSGELPELGQRYRVKVRPYRYKFEGDKGTVSGSGLVLVSLWREK